MLSKISIRRLLVDHLDTLVDHRLREDTPGAVAPRSRGDVLLFFCFPAAVGILVAVLGVRLADSVISATITAFSIFVGLLFNLLALTYEVMRRTAEVNVNNRSRSVDRKKRALREVHANVSFAILVALSIVVLALPEYALSDGSIASRVLTSALVALALNFVLTLLMILKRMHLLMDHEIQHA